MFNSIYNYRFLFCVFEATHLPSLPTLRHSIDYRGFKKGNLLQRFLWEGQMITRDNYVSNFTFEHQL